MHQNTRVVAAVSGGQVRAKGCGTLTRVSMAAADSYFYASQLRQLQGGRQLPQSLPLPEYGGPDGVLYATRLQMQGIPASVAPPAPTQYPVELGSIQLPITCVCSSNPLLS